MKIKAWVEMYIITMSAHSHMLLGSIMKTSQRDRGERESTLCDHRSCGWRQWIQTSLSKELCDLGNA